MNSQQDLKLWQKIIFGLVVLVATIMLPELLYIIDLGGIELIFGFLVLYFKSIIIWLEQKLAEFKSFISAIYTVFLNSALSRPKVLSLQAVYCGLVLSITGSLVFSMSFVFPVLFMSGGI